MEKPVLNDKDQYPTEDVIFSHIGKSKTLWILFFEFIQAEYPEFDPVWNYYNDGKSWLMKITRKSKTILWLSIVRNYFRITLYFTDRAEEAILESKISDELKEQFKNGKHFGKIRGLTINFKRKIDLKYAKELIEIKLKIK